MKMRDIKGKESQVVLILQSAAPKKEEEKLLSWLRSKRKNSWRCKPRLSKLFRN
jgi:hypothetical protein